MNHFNYPKELKDAAQRAEDALMKYIDIIESKDGMLAMTMISGTAASICGGSQSINTLKPAVLRASAISGIPAADLQFHADFMILFYRTFSKQEKSRSARKRSTK